MIATEALLARTDFRRFAALGLDRLAYLRRTNGGNGQDIWLACAADGRVLAEFDSRSDALRILLASDLEAASLH